MLLGVEGCLRARGWFAFTVTFAVIAVAAPDLAALERDPTDREIFARLRQHAPHAAELLEQGEALAAAGSVEKALGLFRQGRAEASYESGLFERRECEALTSLNRRAEAQPVCWQAMQDLRTPTTVRATVRALVSGPTAPSFAELAQALTLLAFERTRAPGNPQLAAAMCDTAESIGDGIMLQRCAEELQRMAPDYLPTRQARRALEARCPPLRFWAGWLAIVAALAITVADSLRRRTHRWVARRGAAAAGVIVFGAFLMTCSAAARADDPKPRWLSQWPIDDQDPLHSVPTQEQMRGNPLEAGYWVQDLILKASLASRRGDHEAAIKYYAAMSKAVPNRALPLTLTCDEYETMGQLDKAVNACGLALMLDGLTVDDYSRYVRLMLRKPGDLTDKETAAITNVIQHMDETETGRAVGDDLECELALRTSNVPKLQECVAVLAATAPNRPKAISYQWALAVQRKDFRLARQLLDQAKAAGFQPDSLESMQQVTEAGASKQRRGFLLAAAGLIVLVGAAAWGLLRYLTRRREGPTACPRPVTQ